MLHDLELGIVEPGVPNEKIAELGGLCERELGSEVVDLAVQNEKELMQKGIGIGLELEPAGVEQKGQVERSNQ